MSRHLQTLFLLAVLSFLFVIPTQAQVTTASMSGTVMFQEILRLMVGKEVICDEEILVVAPVFSVLNFVFAAVITISSKVSEDSFNLTFKL